MKRLALFLDRDGVINVDKEYVHKIEDVEFLDGIFELIAHAKNLHYLVIIITNQSGIGRGIFSEEDFQKLNKWMLDQLKKNGASIDNVYYCPTHPTKGIGKYKKSDNRRKPNPGMIFEAENDYNINLSQSILLGDKIIDMEAGLASGIKNLFLLSKKKKFKNSININSLKEVISFLKKIN